MSSGNYACCIVSCSPLRAENRDQSEMVSQLLFGELVILHETNAPWSKVTTVFDNYEGYTDHKHLKRLSDKEAKRWMDGLVVQQDLLLKISSSGGEQYIYRGSYLKAETSSFRIGTDEFELLDHPSEKFDSPEHAAKSYLNSPYLWGGKSPFGIDCSGFTQIIYRFFDINLPRDASEQADHGAKVEFDDSESGDLAYFENKSGKITHVGIVGEAHAIYHASGHVRKDLLTNEGIIHSETGALTHQLACIKRV